MVHTVEAPRGTVTFVLTDVVGSTALWQQFPDDMAAAVATHEQILRDTFAAHGGYEFGTAGDSFAVAFSDPIQAVQASAEIQRKLANAAWGPAQITVRIGLHAGQAEERDGRYFGPTVSMAARIESLAGPGQVIMSRATHGLVDGRLDQELQTVAVGAHRLKSFTGEHELFQLVGLGLDHEVTLDSRAGLETLPRPATQFIGREGDIALLIDHIAPGKLVTVSGMGGLGKTRIAIEAARAVAPQFPDGVWWIDLVPLTTKAAVATQIATTLGLTPQPGMEPSASVVDGLKRQTVLLVFDNCEHLIDDVASIVQEITHECPSVCVVATTQATLGVAGELNVPLAPLDMASDAVALLLERAQANNARLDPKQWPEQDLLDLCERLDGLPLAIEMAAARLRALSPRDIIERLDDRFRMLTSRDRGRTERHRSMLAALDWSYDLLEHDQRVMLDRLSIFAGTFDLEAATRVCAGDDLDEFDILDLVSDLLEKSLIALDDGAHGARYRMLETVRHYCNDHLRPDGRRELERALVDHCVGLAREYNPRWHGDTRQDFDAARAVYVSEWNNFREAVRYAVEFDDAAAINDILTALWAFSFETFNNEIGEWARLAQSLTSPPVVVLGACAMTTSSSRQAQELLDTAVGRIDDSVPDVGACFCYSVLALTLQAKGDPACVDYARRGHFHSQAVSASEVAFFDANLAGMLIDIDQAAAAECAEAATTYIERSANPMRATCIPPLAWYEAKRGRPEVGYDLCLRGVAMCADAGIYWASTMALAFRARISMRFDVGDQREALRGALTVGREQRAWFAVWLALGESIPWLQTNQHSDAAHTIESYMDAKGIWYRRALPEIGTDARPAHRRAVGAEPLRRDELIDFVLAEIG